MKICYTKNIQSNLLLQALKTSVKKQFLKVFWATEATVELIYRLSKWLLEREEHADL